MSFHSVSTAGLDRIALTTRVSTQEGVDKPASGTRKPKSYDVIPKGRWTRSLMKQLVDRNSEAPSLDPVTALKVIDSLMNDEGATAGELSAKLKIPLKTVMQILSHPEFTKRFRVIKREVAKSEFDAITYDRMMDIIHKQPEYDQNGRSSTDKNAIAAARVLGDLLGVSEKKSVVEHKFSFEEIIHARETKDVTPEDIVFPGFEDE